VGLAIFPVFDRDVPADEAGPSGEVLASELEAIDDFADDADLPGLSDFADSREVPEDFAGTVEELDELLGPSSDWYDAGDGARALGRLADRIDAEASFDGAVEVVAELRDLVRRLRLAADAGARFRLEIG
jgi:hypothetical protein